MSRNEIKKNITLKQTESYLAEIEAKAVAKQRKIEEERKELKELEKKKKSLQKKQEKLKSPDFPECSEHSLLRYLERVKGYDIEGLKKEILNSDVLKMIEKLGKNGTYPHKDGYSIILRNNIVTTIVTKDEK